MTSLLTSLNRVAGANPAPYVESIAPIRIAASGAIVGNTLHIADLPMVAQPLAVAKVHVWVGTSSGNVDVGLWRSDDTTLTLLTSSGSTAVGTGSAEQIISLLATVVLQPRTQYYVGICPDNVTATWGRDSAGVNFTAVGPVNPGGSKASQFPLASNATSVAHSGFTAVSNRFWMRVAAT